MRDGYRVFFDTNILLDYLDPKRPQSKEASEVVALCNGSGDMGVVCPMSLKDVYYIIRRALSEPRAREAVEVLMAMLVIAPFSAEECDLAIRSDEPDFEDGLIRASAELNGADVILTRDAAAFEHSKVRSMDCATYLREWR